MKGKDTETERQRKKETKIVICTDEEETQAGAERSTVCLFVRERDGTEEPIKRQCV